jgi:hypothetical protein
MTDLVGGQRTIGSIDPPPNGIDPAVAPKDLTRECRSLLRKRLLQYFSMDELKTLCYELVIEFDDLGDGNRENKVHKLITSLVSMAKKNSPFLAR